MNDKQQRQQQQDDADHPVEFARRFVAAGEKDTIHVQPDGDHHGVRTPAMQFAQDAQRRHVAQRQDVVVGPFQRRPVIEHQQHAGDRFDQKQEEGHPAHAPGIAEGDALLLDRHRMQVQKEVGQHDHDAVAAILRGGMAEDALPDLRFANHFTDRHRYSTACVWMKGVSKHCRSESLPLSLARNPTNPTPPAINRRYPRGLFVLRPSLALRVSLANRYTTTKRPLAAIYTGTNDAGSVH